MLSKLYKENIKSGVYGLAIGDALGVPVEFSKREMLDQDPVIGMREYGTHNQPKGTWSDDTSMVLATLDAMCWRGFSLPSIMDMFVKWLYNAEYTAGGVVFDVGGTCNAAINNWRMGEGIDKCGECDEYSNGNGSLMRMLPLVYWVYQYYGSGICPESVNAIYVASGLTHAHIVSKVSCVYYVYIGIYVMIYGHKRGLKKSIREAIEDVETYYYEGEDTYIEWEVAFKNTLKTFLELPRELIESTGFVVDSLIASVWCLYNTGSYKEAVLRAVNLGGDTDTIAAITGSIAGLYYGYEDIPKEWIKDLQNKELIEDICERFYTEIK